MISFYCTLQNELDETKVKYEWVSVMGDSNVGIGKDHNRVKVCTGENGKNTQNRSETNMIEE